MAQVGGLGFRLLGLMAQVVLEASIVVQANSISYPVPGAQARIIRVAMMMAKKRVYNNKHDTSSKGIKSTELGIISS